MVGRNLLEHPGIDKHEVIAPRSNQLNLLDFEAVTNYLKDQKPDLVIHCAGKVGGISANIEEPVNFLLENLDMGRNIVWGARKAGIKRLINLGSSCMYPRNHNEPLREQLILTGELEPTNEGYALAKIITARLCEYISREDSNYQYKTLIPCNLYGRHDKFEPARSHLIPAIIHKTHQAMQNGDETVEIWGDGAARREFMYAGDLADALVMSIEKFDTLPSTMNIGLGFDFSIKQYYQTVADVLGYNGRFTHDLSKPVGMARKLVCVERLEKWGWKAKSELATGIAKTYQYYLTEIAP